MVINLILNYVGLCNLTLYCRYCKSQIKTKGLQICQIANNNVPVLVFKRLATLWHFILHVFACKQNSRFEQESLS